MNGNAAAFGRWVSVALARGHGSVRLGTCLAHLSTASSIQGKAAMIRKMTVVKSIDKEGREVFTYLKSPAPPQPKKGRARKRSHAIKVTLKLPR